MNTELRKIADYLLLFNKSDRNIMKKLKRFVLNDARMLSRNELALIEGGLDISAVDYCTASTNGQTCVYSVGYDSTGHYSVTLDKCFVSHKQEGSAIITVAYCM